jgi:glycosyltransferase involved in cell wall biosynthesis
MRVSVYMPTKNRVELLQRAVASVLSQTHRELELWVVNDGSTDATAAFLDRASAADSRLKVVHNPTSLGAPASRNIAITRATGDVITGLDDDDTFHPQRIEKLVTAWREHEAVGARFSCLFTQDLLVAPDETEVSKKPARVSYMDLFSYNTLGNQVFTKRQYLIDAGLFDEQMPAWQDLDMFIRLLRTFGPALLVDEPLYILDLAPRDDRISYGNRARIYAAYQRLSGKLSAQPPAARQALFLQLFGRLYGFDFGWRDCREFFRMGLHVRTLKSLGGILLRQRQRKAAVSIAREERGRSAPTLRSGGPRVLMFPKHSNNPYLSTLSERLEQRGAQVEDFTFARAYSERFDVVHIHWPDLHLHARSWWRSIAKQVRLAALLTLLRVRGTRIVWTIHNLKPHERHHTLPEMLFPIWFPRLCTHVIAMTASGLAAAQQEYPPLVRKATAVIPHGHYRDAYPSAASRSASRAQLGLADRFTFLFFGSIRRYKNVPLLIEAFRNLHRQDVQLLIVGQPLKLDIEPLQRSAANDSRIRLHLEFVPERAVPLYMGAADVVVLPFDSILNSGSVLLALSFNRAVLAPRLGSLPEIQHRVGARWVTLYDGPLSTAHLMQAMHQDLIDEGEIADLGAFEWDAITQQTLDLYGTRTQVCDHMQPAKVMPESR